MHSKQGRLGPNELWLLLFLWTPGLSHAHFLDETITTIKMERHSLQVDIELPATFYGALRSANENPEDLSQSKLIELGADYILKNFTVYENGEIVSHDRIVLPDTNARLFVNYKIFYGLKNGENVSVENKLLFEVYEDQTNFAMINLPEGELLTAETSKINPTIVLSIPNSKDKQFQQKGLMLAGLIGLLGLGLVFSRKIHSKSVKRVP